MSTDKNNVIAIMDDGEDFVVERIIGVKFFDNILKFYVVWEGFPSSCNTFESINNVINCIAFNVFIDNFYSSLHSEILIEQQHMKFELKEKIEMMLLKTKKESLLQQINQHQVYEFKAYQVAFHLIEPNEGFNEIFRELFIRNTLFDLQFQQQQQLSKLLHSIPLKFSLTVTITNDIDFSVPEKFTYTNMLMTGHTYKPRIDSSYDLSLIKKEDITLKKQMQSLALCIFKTDDRGWGLKTTETIPKGTDVVECAGEVLSRAEAASRSDKSYFLPVPVQHHGQNFIVDALSFGNISRFVNHSCRPNCEIKQLPSKGSCQKLSILAIRNINKNEEITINYSYGPLGQFYDIKCLCKDEACNKRF